jgi:hypothetical protein
VPWLRLGDWPTPVEELRLGGGPPIWVKREDRSSRRYGGNKVRTLEAVLGRAAATGSPRIWAIGAYGSNHALATVTHAATAGMTSGVAIFPQPLTGPARANLSAILAGRPAVALMRTPISAADRSGAAPPPPGRSRDGPGGPRRRVRSARCRPASSLPSDRRRADADRAIVIAVGSTRTSAGLLVGLLLATAASASASAPTAVRCPWSTRSGHPVAGHQRHPDPVAGLARTRLLESLVGPTRVHVEAVGCRRPLARRRLRPDHRARRPPGPSGSPAQPAPDIYSAAGRRPVDLRPIARGPCCSGPPSARSATPAKPTWPRRRRPCARLAG